MAVPDNATWLKDSREPWTVAFMIRVNNEADVN